jgi:hypothetical protein
MWFPSLVQKNRNINGIVGIYLSRIKFPFCIFPLPLAGRGWGGGRSGFTGIEGILPLTEAPADPRP